MPTSKKRDAKDWLAESDHWDSLSVEELWETSEPVEEKLVDARPKKAISLRLTESLIEAGKEVAAELDIGYQTLFRMWIREGLRRHKLQKLEEAAARKRRSAQYDDATEMLDKLVGAEKLKEISGRATIKEGYSV